MDEEEIDGLVSLQKRELMAARDVESDLELAFRLQMQEAMSASLSFQPSTSASSSTVSPSLAESVVLDDDVSRFADIQTLELDKFHQERKDRRQSEAEMHRMLADLNRRVHDQKFAREILVIPEEDWQDFGDNVEKPFGEGCSSRANDEPFSLYFKGLVRDEIVRGSSMVLSGIGAAICDPCGTLIFKVQKPLVGDGMIVRVATIKALIEGLNAALSLNIKRINFYCDYYPLYQFMIGKWTVKQRKIATLIDQVVLLQKRFTSCRPVFVARHDIKFAFKLARDAIDSQISKFVEYSEAVDLKETCSICLESTEANQMFAVDVCSHRYCYSCMRQHVEVKLLHGMIPECPHDGCKSKLNVESCKKFLTHKLVDIMNQRIKEASIPVADKIYCPYPRCSVLMSKVEVLEYTNDIFMGAERSGVRKCIKCHGLFCINCKVPWHGNMTCNDFKRLNPPPEDRKLKSLATEKLWRQCVKCNHMIELAEGCFHMTCRCGYEFCYTCGAEWKNKKATCTCPLWNEENIIYDEDYEDDFDEDDEYFSEDYYDSDWDEVEITDRFFY